MRLANWNLKLGALFAVLALLTIPALAWPPGGNGGGGGGNGGGGGEDPPPTYNLPPFSYAVDTILVEGMGNYYDTNDYGVSAISTRPFYVSTSINTSYDAAAAALVHPDGSVDYLDNLIDPTLPYDLGGAIDVNNVGQILVAGFVANDYDHFRAMLLSPNPNSITDGYAYSVVLIPLPDWGPGWDLEAVYGTFQLTESGDALYGVRGTFTDGSNSYSPYVRLSDGTIEDLSGYYFNGQLGDWSDVYEVNSQSTLLVNTWDPATGSADYLVEADGTIVWPEFLQGVTSAGVQINDLAESGYSCGIQTIPTGQVKVKGKWVTQYRTVPVVYDPAGNASAVAFRDDMEINSSWRVLNEQVVAGEPIAAGVDNRIPDFWLAYPTYDAAYVTELMDDANKNAFRDLFHWENPARAEFMLSTPRLPNGDVDNSGAPTFWGAMEKVVYPNGQSGSAGIYVIYPITP